MRSQSQNQSETTRTLPQLHRLQEWSPTLLRPVKTIVATTTAHAG
jgi:hypothetical protein